MGDFGKKIFCRLSSKGKTACKEVTGKNNILHLKKISLMTDNAEKKNLTALYAGEKILA